MKKSEQRDAIQTFFDHRKDIFETIGQRGHGIVRCAIGLSIILLPLFLIASFGALMDALKGVNAIHSVSGLLPPSFFQGPYIWTWIWGLFLLSGLLGRYKKGQVFCKENTWCFVKLGALNMVFGSVVYGIMWWALAMVIPNKESP